MSDFKLIPFYTHSLNMNNEHEHITVQAFALYTLQFLSPGVGAIENLKYDIGPGPLSFKLGTQPPLYLDLYF